MHTAREPANRAHPGRWFATAATRTIRDREASLHRARSPETTRRLDLVTRPSLVRCEVIPYRSTLAGRPRLRAAWNDRSTRKTNLPAPTPTSPTSKTTPTCQSMTWPGSSFAQTICVPSVTRALAERTAKQPIQDRSRGTALRSMKNSGKLGANASPSILHTQRNPPGDETGMIVPGDHRSAMRKTHASSPMMGTARASGLRSAPGMLRWNARLAEETARRSSATLSAR